MLIRTERGDDIARNCDMVEGTRNIWQIGQNGC
jgi:hypothetical protein